MAKQQTFRSTTGVVVWVVWLLFAVGNWIDLAVQGRDHESAIAAALLLLGTGVAYVTAQRPRIIADDAGLTIRNPLREYRIGWAGVAKVDVIDLLRVHCDGGVPGDKKHRKVISAWAVHYSRRRKLAAEARARRAARFGRRPAGLAPGGRNLSYGAVQEPRDASTAEAEAEKIVRLLSERATAARAEAVWSAGTAPPAVTKTAVAPPAVAESPTASGPTASGPAASGPAASGPAASGPAASGPTASGPAASGSTPTGPKAVKAAGWPEPLTSKWSGGAIAAVVIPALIVLIIWLI